MKKIMVSFPGEMELGGVETSLIGLLDSFDYDQCDVDFFLYGHHGALFPYIDKRARLLPEVRELAYLRESLKAKLTHGCWRAVLLRILADIRGRFGKPVPLDRVWARLVKWCAKTRTEHYDIALGFFLPFDYIVQKIDADIKIGWIHTDYTGFTVDTDELRRVYSPLDFIAAVSEECKMTFCKLFPELSDKVIVIENVLPKSLVEKRSNEFTVETEMPDDGMVKLLTIGRFSPQKKIDEIPEICRKIREQGVNIKWYIIGYGGEEPLIRQKIAEAGMEEYVVILGKKENPYPYIKACDVYVQPSRYEGKSVAVREAQMLAKPVIITNYATAQSQLEDSVDGVIVPMEIDACAREMVRLLRSPETLRAFAETCKTRDYSNRDEVGKLYTLCEGENER